MDTAKRPLGARLAALLLAAALLCPLISALTLPLSASPGTPARVDLIESGRQPDASGRYETAFRDNRWRISFSARTVTYYGGWTAGCVMTGQGYRHFSYLNSTDGNWLMLDATDQWQSPAGTVGQGEIDIRPASQGGSATGIGYTAEFTGRVSFSLDSLSSDGENGFAIFSGEKMIWPTPGGEIGAAGDLSGWYPVDGSTPISAINGALSSFSYTCCAQETLSFVFKRGSGSGYCHVEPRVTYLSAAQTGGHRSEISLKGENFPTYTIKDGQAVLASGFGGGWSFGSFPRTSASDYTLFSKINGTYKILTRSGGDEWTYGGLYLENGVVINANNYVSFFGYTAPYTGTLSIAVDRIAAEKSASGEDIMFCILHNDTMLFPTPGGRTDAPTDYGDWYCLTATGANAATATRLNGAALTDLSVKAGDLIRFCITARSGHSMTARDISFSVTYTGVASSLPTTEEASVTLSDSYPTLSPLDSAGNGSVLAYNGRWRYEAAPRGTQDFSPLYTVTGGALLPGETRKEGYILPLVNNRSCAFLAPGSGYDLALSYTVRYAGRATLTLKADDLGGDTRCGFAILHNGVRIDGADRVNRDTLNGKSVTLTLHANDTIRILLSSLGGREAGESGMTLLPTLTYTELSDHVALTGVSLGLSQGLTAYFYVGADQAFSEMEEYGILVWHKKPHNFDRDTAEAERIRSGTLQSDFRMRFTYAGIAAKQMTDTLWVRPYFCNEGTTVYGDPISFSVLSYAEQLYGRSAVLDTLLTDMLLYGAAAQEYFDYHTERLATATLTPDQMAAASANAYLHVNRKSIGRENTRNPSASRITAFSLSLSDRITYCAYVDIAPSEAAAPVVLEVSRNASMTECTEYTVGADGFVKGMPIHAAEVGRVFYFRLRTLQNGKTCYGPIISYSVESYTASLAAVGQTDMTALSTALIRYGYSALAYATAVQ